MKYQQPFFDKDDHLPDVQRLLLLGFLENPSLHLQSPLRLFSWTGTHSSFTLQSWRSRPTSQPESWKTREDVVVWNVTADAVVVVEETGVGEDVDEVCEKERSVWRLGSTSDHDAALSDVLTRTINDFPRSFSILSDSGVAGRQYSSSVHVAWNTKFYFFQLKP